MGMLRPEPKYPNTRMFLCLEIRLWGRINRAIKVGSDEAHWALDRAEPA